MTAKAVRWVALMLMCSTATATEWCKRYDSGLGDDAADGAEGAGTKSLTTGLSGRR